MIKKVSEAVKRFGLIGDAKHITVALSGGADSMALLTALIKLKQELGITKISAAHFNHGIRGEEALRDQRFVQNYCKSVGVECLVGSADVPEYAKQNHLSIELAARELRYRFFDSINTDLIATAHTASDNIETVLFNLTRGTALSGLCGIPPKRDKYIRPLILCTREDVEDFCKEQGVDFVTDSTNLCDDYTRNKLRHNVVPVLKTVNESVALAVSRMTSSLSEDEDYINSVVLEHFSAIFKDGALDVSGFKNIHPAIAKRLIVKYCDAMCVEIDNLHVNEIFAICINGGKKSLIGDKSAIVKNGILTVEHTKQPQQNIDFQVDITQQDNDLYKKSENVHNLLLKNVLDCDKIVGCLKLRTRELGDSIRLKNKNGTKTLKKLFCEYKIPLCERENLPVLCDGKGVVWIHKIGVAERAAADQNSKHIYKITVKQI